MTLCFLCLCGFTSIKRKRAEREPPLSTRINIQLLKTYRTIE